LRWGIGPSSPCDGRLLGPWGPKPVYGDSSSMVEKLASLPAKPVYGDSSSMVEWQWLREVTEGRFFPKRRRSASLGVGSWPVRQRRSRMPSLLIRWRNSRASRRNLFTATQAQWWNGSGCARSPPRASPLRGALFPEAPAISQLGRRELACAPKAEQNALPLMVEKLASLPAKPVYGDSSSMVEWQWLREVTASSLSLSRRKQVSPGGSRVSGKTVGGQHTGAVLEVGDRAHRPTDGLLVRGILSRVIRTRHCQDPRRARPQGPGERAAQSKA
jgi:hypothetical protein